MGTIKKPYPVKLVCPALAFDDRWFARAEAVMQEKFGPVELTRETWDFTFTDYYRDLMGDGLRRRIYSFRDLICPGQLAEIKRFTNEQEIYLTGKYNSSAERAVNLDPGYICGSKLVLATTKDYSHRIYLSKGIFAEITLKWGKKGFEPLDETYPDYQTEDYRDFFAYVRAVYLKQLDNIRANPYPEYPE